MCKFSFGFTFDWQASIKGVGQTSAVRFWLDGLNIAIGSEWLKKVGQGHLVVSDWLINMLLYSDWLKSRSGSLFSDWLVWLMQMVEKIQVSDYLVWMMLTQQFGSLWPSEWLTRLECRGAVEFPGGMDDSAVFFLDGISF